MHFEIWFVTGLVSRSNNPNLLRLSNHYSVFQRRFVKIRQACAGYVEILRTDHISRKAHEDKKSGRRRRVEGGGTADEAA